MRETAAARTAGRARRRASIFLKSTATPELQSSSIAPGTRRTRRRSLAETSRRRATVTPPARPPDMYERNGKRNSTKGPSSAPSRIGASRRSRGGVRGQRKDHALAPRKPRAHTLESPGRPRSPRVPIRLPRVSPSVSPGRRRGVAEAPRAYQEAPHVTHPPPCAASPQDGPKSRKNPPGPHSDSPPPPGANDGARRAAA